MKGKQMKRGITNIFTAVIVLSLAVACASNPSETVPLEEKLAQLGFAIGKPVRSVINFQLSGWSTVDHKHVIMNFGASRNYLLTLRTSCDGLRSATLINFSTTVGSLTDKDKVLVRNESRHLSQCYISTIHELEKIDKTDKDQ